MRAPINLEGFFGLLVVLGACVVGAREFRRETGGENDSRRWWWLLLLIPAAMSWSVTFPLVSDDFSHVWYALHFAPHKILELFTIPAGDHFFRPLGYISYIVDGQWAGRSPVLWHISTLLFHFANCVLVYVVGRQQGLARFFAATAALIFGVHGSRPEAVTWLACRFDLAATLFVLLTLVLLQLSERRSWLYGAALMTTLLALISKESAYVLPVLLVVVARADWRTAIRRVAPFAVLTAAVFFYRWSLLHGIGGYQTAQQTPAIYNFNIWHTLNALFRRLWATLFFPINWSEPAEWWLWVALVAGIAAYVVIAVRGQRDRRMLSFLAFAFVAALPVQHLLLIGLDLEKSRVLYLPSVGFALFLAAVLETLRSPRWRVPAALAIVCFQIACLEHNLIIWRGVARVAERTCNTVAAALQGHNKSITIRDLPNMLRGVYFLHTGVPGCVYIMHGINADRVQLERGELTYEWDPVREDARPVSGNSASPGSPSSRPQ